MVGQTKGKTGGGRGRTAPQLRPLVATCSRGLEEILAVELGGLGGVKVAPGRGMVSFQGDRATMIRCCLGLRTAMRVLIPLRSGAVRNREELYSLASSVAWEDSLDAEGSLSVQVAGASPAFDNTRFAALVVKDAIVDRMRRRRGKRPSIQRDRPDFPVHLHLGRECSLSLDCAGTPLSRRGYRPKGGPAPLNEALAAGLLLLAGYDGTRPLLDPMGGTGTFAIEAAQIATASAPGLYRDFAFQRWPGHRSEIYDRVREELRERIKPAPCPILTTDADIKAVRTMKRNVGAAGMEDWVSIRQSEATAMEAPEPGALIVINPPYGKRIGEESALIGVYSAIGDRLKAVAAGCTAWILMGNRELSRNFGLQASRRIPVFNGAIECRWMRFDLYEGSRKIRSGEGPESGDQFASD